MDGIKSVNELAFPISAIEEIEDDFPLRIKLGDKLRVKKLVALLLDCSSWCDFRVGERLADGLVARCPNGGGVLDLTDDMSSSKLALIPPW